MVAIEHLHADALLFVLVAAALALFALRVTLSVCQRARLARDLAFMTPSGRTGRARPSTRAVAPAPARPPRD